MLILSATAAGDDVNYVWDFGDGESASGVYTVTVTASNSLGEQVASLEVTIEFGALLPQIDH